MKNLFFAVAFWLLFAACASITSPNGGPKDIIPPALVSSNPEPNQLNFKGKIIEMEFDEAVQLKTPKEEIIISPRPGKEIEFKVKGTKVTIAPKDGWRDSTTYSLQFREGIADLNERNVPPNLKLAFSTGPNIDSLRIEGTVTDVLKGGQQENITVALYQQDTFDIFSHTPSYFTKTDKTGKFSLTNIKGGVYKIYAFDDKNKNLKTESRSESFGFIADSLLLDRSLDSVTIGLVRVDSRPLKINTIRNAGSITRLRFNKFIQAYTVQSQPEIVHSFAGSQEEILFWNPPGDSVQLTLSATDSIGSNVDSTFFIKKTNTRTITESFKWSLGRPQVESETGKFSTTLSFNKPIENINFDSLFIEIDTVNRVSIRQNDILFDTLHNQITVTKELDKAIFKGEKDPLLNLRAGAGFVHTVDSDTSRRLSTNVRIHWPEDLGVLLVNVSTTVSSYILQLVTTDGKVIASVPNAEKHNFTVKHTFKNLAPGDYQLRVIVDTNSNGNWDPGNVYKRQEPEKVIYYIGTNRKQSFPVRANWELGPLLIVF